MKTWCVKSTAYSLQSRVINILISLIYILSTTLAAIPLGTRPVTSPFLALVTYVKRQNLYLITNIWKRRQRKEKEIILNGKFDCFLQSRLSKTLNVSVNQKTRLRISFKTCSGVFETLSRPFETLGRVFGKLDRVFVLHYGPCCPNHPR